MIVVWGLCHQLGFFYDRLVAATRRTDWTLLWGGLFGLAGLVGTGLYPGSMVGVPGERSNMAPPTLCIVALVLFQAGVVEVLRPWMEQRLDAAAMGARQRRRSTASRCRCSCSTRPGWRCTARFATRSPGERNEAREPTLWWWLYRPLAFIGPLLFTLPVIYLFGRQWMKRPCRWRHDATAAVAATVGTACSPPPSSRSPPRSSTPGGTSRSSRAATASPRCGRSSSSPASSALVVLVAAGGIPAEGWTCGPGSPGSATCRTASSSRAPTAPATSVIVYPIARGGGALLAGIGGILFLDDHIGWLGFVGLCVVAASLMALSSGAQLHQVGDAVAVALHDRRVHGVRRPRDPCHGHAGLRRVRAS